MDSVSTLQLLLQEAQQEIASLRSDLYTQRRVAEERRQAVQALTIERDGLHARVQHLDNDLGQCQSRLTQLQGVEQQYQALQELHAKLQRDFDFSVGARKILEGELSDERKQRQMTEAAKASLEAERSRQVKAKDDLAAALRVAQRKASEAEEEQLRAEEEAAALRAELESLHAAGSHGGHMGASTHDAVPSAAARDADWQEQLEYERNRAAVLLSSLHAAKSEIAALSQQLGSQRSQAGEVQQLHVELAKLKQELSEATSTSQKLSQQLADAQAAHQTALVAAAATVAQHPSSTSHPAHPTHDHHHHHQSAHGHESASSSAPRASSSNGGHAPVHSHIHTDSNRGVGLHHQRSSTSGSGTELSADLMALEKLQDQVAKLKASRDKLLAQIDKQWEEMDRLVADNKAATDELERARALAEGWEAQAQDGLSHVERLKEMLEEAATWSSGQAGAGAAPVNPYMAAVNGTVPAPQAMEAALLAEKARSTELELQLRALASELLRSQQASMSIGRAVLPVLSGIEYRLSDMFSKAQLQQVQV